MSCTDLKMLILYDLEDNEYAVVEHNLAADVATGRAVQMRAQNIPAFAVEQSTKHRTIEARNCKACERDVRGRFAVRQLRRRPKPIRRKHK
jgi:hypothetical protein